MMDFFSRGYQRKKRIARILSLQAGLPDPYRIRQDDEVESNFLFPRYTWLRFILTFIMMVLLSAPVTIIFNILFKYVMNPKIKILLSTPISMMMCFVAVEIVDDLFLRWEKDFKSFKKKFMPGIVFFILVLTFFAFKNPTVLQRTVNDWVDVKNQEIQLLPQEILIQPVKGLNWRFNYEDANILKTVDLNLAENLCKSIGPYWQVYDGDKSFVPQPQAILSRPFFVWQGKSGALLETTGIKPPKTFAPTKTGSKFYLLCINKRIK